MPEPQPALQSRAFSLSSQAGALAALVERTAPGGRLTRTRRLRGGLGCRMDVLDIERADGSRWKVSLRRFVREHRFSKAAHVRQEFEVLRLVEAAEILAPRPVLLDADGQYFGVPAMVMTYLPGRPLFANRNIEVWTARLAEALHTVHAVTPDRFDLSWLDVHLHDAMREKLAGWDALQADPFTREINSVLDAKLDGIELTSPSLIHNDYWPGNTVWNRGRMVGIVDWSSAIVGDPRTDVAQCRVDLMFSHGKEAAELFRADYECLAERALCDLWYFDLLLGVRALLECEKWLVGYHDMGLRAIRTADVKARLRAFLLLALAEARRES